MEFGLFMEFVGLDDTTDQQAFKQGFALVDEAERMGVDSVWLAEYHLIPFSVLSAPITVATAIAARTERMRIGFGVVLLPLGNPIRIAEEIATLDHISQGTAGLAGQFQNGPWFSSWTSSQQNVSIDESGRTSA